MANEEHLTILKQGIEVWNQWRKDNPEIRPDLYAAFLSGDGRRKVALNDADFHDADLSYVILRDADLSYANFIKANLSYADLRGTNFNKSNFNNANFNNTDLRYANCINSDLMGANFLGADLSNADLSNADLSNAELISAYFNDANLSKTNFTNTRMNTTVFGTVDLSEAIGLENVRHEGPSTVGIDTIYKSKGNIPYKFLLDAGIPKDDIHYLLSLAGKSIDFYSCFISYSSKDQVFIARLHADLQAKGVRCWFAPEDLKIGEPILAGIDKGIRLHDKLLIVLSEHSVASRWVEHEVESASDKEMRSDRKTKVLFPIRLDNAIMNADMEWAYRIRQRHIGDFTHWKDHDAYQQAFERLLRDLKAEG